jgi:hypothetical protein
MKVENSLTPARAKLYRPAAAITAARRDVATFYNLATMFQQLAQHFWSTMPLPTSLALATVVP